MQLVKEFTILLVVLVLFKHICAAIGINGNLTDVVQTHKGPIRGETAKTVQNSSIEYSAFRGIPYAKPPIGPLRFQPPVEIDAWTEIFNATSEPRPCSQISEDKVRSYNEDCLYLNVYSPKKSFSTTDNELLAVLVYIYGGTFFNGDSNSSHYGPDFLITENVIVVTFNYRIGAFGFLSLDIDETTGNMGMKDQLLALKWVQKNIENFGGDPKKVTIFGQSAGSASVMLHILSPASRGLFSGAIAMSGSPLNLWAFAPKSQAVLQTYNLGRKLGFYNFFSDRKEYLERFRNASVKQIVEATNDLKDEGFLTFSPTCEDPKKAKDVFLTECPVSIYKAGNFAQVPVILGFVKNEALGISSFAFDWISTVRTTISYLISFSRLGNPFLNFFDSIIKSAGRVVDDLTKHLIYFTSKLITDVIFIAGIDSTQKYLSRGSQPVYYYRNSFDYDNSRHRVLGIELYGTSHADDIPQILWQADKRQSLDVHSSIGIQRTKMVRLWTNFAKYRNPTPNGAVDPLLNVTWSPSGSEGLHLEIGQNGLSMGPRPTDYISEIAELFLFNPFGCIL